LLRDCACAAILAVAPLCCAPKASLADDAARAPTAPRAASNRVETVRFADPRWPAVRIVRGGGQAKPAPTLPPVTATQAVAAPPVFRATPANTQLVSFGDGTGEVVHVVRGSAPSPAGTAPVPTPSGRVETVRFASPGAPLVNIIRGGALASDGVELFGAATGGELDRVAFAVDGAESGHGSNLAMWRPEPDGPQGPMQVSAAAALDVGGGDRFDMRQNRLIGRAYLARLYQRYGNWPDAIAAYNWGPGSLDQWIVAGRPIDRLPLETARYLLKVLRDAFLLRPS
jgi:hypothetical protein